jgi:hypothetical protein
MDRRTVRFPAVALVALVLAALVAAPPALASPAPAVVDCTTHNGLTKHYTVAQLQQALGTMSAEVKEYTSCGDVIQHALDSELGGLHVNGSGGSGGGSFLPVPVIIVLVVLLLGGAGYGAVVLRRRGENGPQDGGEQPPTQVRGP